MSIGATGGIDPSLLLGYYQSSVSGQSPTATSAAVSLTNPATSGDTVGSLDSSLLLSYYQAKLPVPTQAPSAAGAVSTNSATANDVPPWLNTTQQDPTTLDAQILSDPSIIDTGNVPLTANSPDEEVEQDNQQLFSLYQALTNLTTLAGLSQQSTATPGQLEGYNTRFQAGLSQIASYLSTPTFNNFTLQMTQPSSSVTSTVSMPTSTEGYTGATITNDANVESALPNLSTSDSFNISVTKGGKTTNIPIVLSQVQGPLTIDNIDNFINQQLQAGGFSTRFQRAMTEGTIDDPTKASYGIVINASPLETVALSSSSTQPALYISGTTGSAANTTTTAVSTDATTGTTTDTSTSGSDMQGRLIKLSELDGTPQSVFSANVAPSTGNTTVAATAVDTNGDVYVVGNATGNFGQQLNQGSQDVYLSKYDSRGNMEWTKLLGSAASASGYSLATTPSGGVVVAGSTTADLSSTAVADGNTDTFVAQYDAAGNQTWVQQLQTLADNQASAVSVDGAGNIYIGGQVSGEVSKGQTDAGGSDAYIAKLNSSGKILYEQQFGTSGEDSVSATATTADGSLVVASVQNGDAIVSKYANGDATAAPVWQVDLGNLQSGSVAGLSVSGDNIYVSGTTKNGNLTAGGQATIASPNTGGQNAFVFGLTDADTSVTADQVSYVVANGGGTTAGGLTVGPDGTVYLAGTTNGTFPGATRNVTDTNNAFVAALGSGGVVNWAQQYGGADGQSTGTGIAIDPQGASVLDALGLPRGTIDSNDQTVDLTQATTLRAGDSFSIDVQGTVPRTVNITIDQGETLSSLANKISGELSFNGKASVTYTGTGEALKIQVNPGVTATLVSGPADSDALARLGIAPGTLSSAATSTTSSTGSSTTPSTTSTPATTTATDGSTSSTALQVFGLGIPNDLSISTATDAGIAQGELQAALSQIQSIYTKTNTPATSGATNTATGPADLQAQIVNYTTALNLLDGGSSSTSGLSLSI